MKTIYLSLLICILSVQLGISQVKNPLASVNSDFVEYAPTLSSDGKIMIFQSNRDGGFKLYESFLGADGNWSLPNALETINRFFKPNFLIGGPSLSADGKTLYFCGMLKNSTNDMDIFVSKKSSKNEWSSPSSIGKPINTTDSETFPSIAPDGKKLYFVSTYTKNTADRCATIMMSELNEKGNWGEPTLVKSPSNASCDKSPRVAYDNTTLLYASALNEGNYDLYRTQLVENTTWSTPVALDYINSTDSELYPSFSPFEDFIYYSKKGDIATTLIPDNHKLHGIGITSKLVDAETGKQLSGNVYLIDTIAKDTLKRLKVTGTFSVHIPAGKTYKLLATSTGYYPYSISYLPTFEEAYQKQDAPLKLKYKKKEIVFNVADKDNNKGLKVKIKVTNLDTKEEMLIDANAGRDGKYAVSLKEGNKYNIEISSIEGYAFSNTIVDVPLSSDSEETIYTPSSENDSTALKVATKIATEMPIVDIKMEPLKDNTQLMLNDIYFLFNKFLLEAESYKELDKVVSLMKANPSAKIEIAAHTDDIGSDDFNNNLSMKRAQEIVNYLNSKGIATSRSKPKGYGKQRPIDLADSDEARAKNRRVELKILDIK